MLDRIYNATLLLLYRMFFLLYAEARDLVAVGDDTGYRKNSLNKLKEDVYNALSEEVPLATGTTGLWCILSNAFSIINFGDTGLKVPRYNGGLFAPDAMGESEIEAEEGKLTLKNMLRRMVMKRCLYGVDINPLAVELSKLSLWLHAFTAGAPLSFLDHHIKCGNSLIGASMEEIEKRARGLWPLDLGPLQRAVDHMQMVAQLSDASFEEADRSRVEYYKADERVKGYRDMLDSVVAEHFGVSFSWF